MLFFRYLLLRIDQTTPKLDYSMHTSVVLKLVANLRFDISHQYEHNVNSNFQESVNP